ncbi:hypothetical protein PGTUg99_009008 [Puccinia graminis f. sp. tritici]|uniref:Uncharacterized protein n=1 Tax=Puccinia graminis f. sp. tritici TaxID=56615 RepID=A0A5B0MZC7_PUCGR|nr:hypothetical protein PGTUg99_009008 [Puccinia graminis f. sp. tritici]
MPDLPKPIPNPEPVRGLTGFFRICGVRVGTLGRFMPSATVDDDLDKRRPTIS